MSHVTCDVTPSDNTDFSVEVISTEVEMEMPGHDASAIETAEFSEVDRIEVSLAMNDDSRSIDLEITFVDDKDVNVVPCK